MSYHRVLVGTDHSDASVAAAKLAARLASPGARLRIVHVTPLAEMPARIDLRADVQRARLLEWCGRAGLPVDDAIVAFGSAARELAREAELAHADVIAVGHTGMGRLAERVLGSVARSVVRLASCDVLVARGPLPPPGRPAIRSILVATDLYEPSARAAKRALALARANAASLTLIHAIDPDVWQAALQTAPSEYPGATGRVDHIYHDLLHAFNEKHLEGEAKEIVTHGRPAIVLEREARAANADLVVIGTHGAQPIERLLIGTHAESIVERAPCSVLVVR